MRKSEWLPVMGCARGAAVVGLHQRFAKGKLERDRWHYGSAPLSRVSGMNQQCDVSEGCVAAGISGVSEMLLAVLEPYAGKLARTVLRGPRFRKGAWLPPNDFWCC
jgi:hypothetical protein